MIYIGCTGWGDHDSLYNEVPQKDKLKAYSAHFPIVELDASFYAVQPERNVQKWVRETPSSFGFIVKAYQGMTGHSRGEMPFSSQKEMFTAFVDSLQPLTEAGKLTMVLCQFPPWFDCKKEHVDTLKWFKHQLKGLPLSLEFRHQSWFHPQFRNKTLDFMKKEGWIHSVCDEPQTGEGSVPIIAEATHTGKTLVRFHGRNKDGWNHPGGNDEKWRDVRYLYNYSKKELLKWSERIKKLQQQSKDVYVLFNNNSGGDAADNAKTLIQMLGIDYKGLAPKQLNLF